MQMICNNSWCSYSRLFFEYCCRKCLLVCSVWPVEIVVSIRLKSFLAVGVLVYSCNETSAAVCLLHGGSVYCVAPARAGASSGNQRRCSAPPNFPGAGMETVKAHFGVSKQCSREEDRHV